MYSTDEIELDEQLVIAAAIEAAAYSQEYAPLTEETTSSKKKLKRQLRAEALLRLEEAAETTDDFKNIVSWWDKLDSNRERRERDHEVSRGDNIPLEYGEKPFGIRVPYSLNSSIAKQIQKGDFIEYIFFCPHELQELVTENYIYKIINNLSTEHKELLFLSALRKYNAVKIAALRKQTDRNIRKVSKTMLNKIQKLLYRVLSSGKIPASHMTTKEKAFIKYYAKHTDKDRDK